MFGREPGAVLRQQIGLDEADAGRDQVGGIAVAQAVRGDLFFKPQLPMTWCKASCTPPGSSGVVALTAPRRPPWRLGNSNTGLRWICRKGCKSWCGARGRGE